ncbi:hypothetical protein SAMN05443254_102478 [Bradyrhizobium sp. OK095]|nr:hypothetical protein SAMN05443254_102478 [Bradyrhizobium sp. OK095]
MAARGKNRQFPTAYKLTALKRAVRLCRSLTKQSWNEGRSSIGFREGREPACCGRALSRSRLPKELAWHSAIVLPDASTDFRKIRNCVDLSRGRLAARLVTKTNPRRTRGDPCRFAADLLDVATTQPIGLRAGERSRFYCAWGCFSFFAGARADNEGREHRQRIDPFLPGLSRTKQKARSPSATGPFSFVMVRLLTPQSKPSAPPSPARRRLRPCGSPTGASALPPRRCTAPGAAWSCRSRAPSGPWS